MNDLTNHPLHKTEVTQDMKEKAGEYIRNIVKEYHIICYAISNEKKKHDSIMKDFDKALDNLQTRCPHVSTEYHPDASGNNDSYRTCNHCGKEAKYL